MSDSRDPETTKLLRYAFAQHQAGSLDGAVSGYEAAIALSPDDPDAHHLLAAALNDKDETPAAITAIRRAVDLAPKDTDIQQTAARIFHDAQYWPECLAAADAACAAHPDNVELDVMRASALMMLRRYGEAQQAALDLVGAAPKNVELRVFLTRVFMAAKQWDDAVAAAQAAVDTDPDHLDARLLLTACLRQVGRTQEAIGVLQECLTLAPRHPNVLNEKGELAIVRGDTAGAVDAWRDSVENSSLTSYAMSRLCFYITFDHRATEPDIFAINQAYSRHMKETMSPVDWPAPAPPRTDGRIRLAYIANDLYANTTLWFFEPLLRRHDRSKFHITCYSGTDTPDAATAELQSLVDDWREVDPQNVAETAKQIRRDGIDILTIVSCYRGEDRQVLAYKPAPIQVVYSNRVASTALDTVDYMFSEELVDPTGQVESEYSEALVRLRNRCCYGPPGDLPDLTPPPCLENGYITFGSFNNHGKIHEEVIRVWTDLLRAVPNSRLIMRSSTAFGDPDTRARYADMFAACGLDLDRVDFQGARPTRRDHFVGIGEADIALDPFPCNGGTTTCEAFAMGLPVISMLCETFMSRQGISYLSMVDLGDLVARSPDEYVTIGAALAYDIERLKLLRAGLRRHSLETVGNFDRHIQDVENAYVHMWQRHREGLPPAAFRVCGNDVCDDPPLPVSSGSA